MNKKAFYTDEFYNSPMVALDLFNSLREARYDFDMYQNGDVLCFTVHENQETLDAVKTVIKDMEAYNKHCDDLFGRSDFPSKHTKIDLTGIYEDHKEAFGYDDNIVWDRYEDKFWLRGPEGY